MCTIMHAYILYASSAAQERETPGLAAPRERSIGKHWRAARSTSSTLAQRHMPDQRRAAWLHIPKTGTSFATTLVHSELFARRRIERLDEHLGK